MEYKKGIFVHFFQYFIGVRHMHATQPKTISFGHFYIFSYIFVDWNDLDLLSLSKSKEKRAYSKTLRSSPSACVYASGLKKINEND